MTQTQMEAELSKLFLIQPSSRQENEARQLRVNELRIDLQKIYQADPARQKKSSGIVLSK